MRSQIEGLANLIGSSYENFDIYIKPFFKSFPVQLIPAINFTYKNLKEIIIEEKTICKVGIGSLKKRLFWIL